MDWDLCMICQTVKKKEALRGREKGGSYDTLSEMLPKFAEIGRFDLKKFGCVNNKIETLVARFREKRAVYHKSCVDAFNQQKFDRLKKCKRAKEEEEQSSEGCKRVTRSVVPSAMDMGELRCIFCWKVDTANNLSAAGTLHATSEDLDHDHNQGFTQRLREKALYLNDARLINLLAVGTVAMNEFNYHKPCLSSFNNSYRDTFAKKSEKRSDESARKLREAVNFRKIVEFIQEQRQVGEKSFDISPLEGMYLNLLDQDGIEHNCPHVGRFGNRLIDAFSSSVCELRTINKKKKLFFTSDVDDILHEICPASFVDTLFKSINPIRAEMSNIVNEFRLSFPPKCQENSVPIQLQVLCSLLIDGSDPEVAGFSQASKSVAQTVMFQYRKTRSKTVSVNRRHSKERETPVAIYVGLRLYASLRAKTTIQKLFFLGICISYERCLDICDHIGTLILKKYDEDGVFIGSNLKTNVFTIVAKDNVDLNASSTKMKNHFHGISMTQIQFPSKANPGIDQVTLFDMSTDVPKRKLKLPAEYIELKDLPCETTSPLYVPLCTLNIEYKDANLAEFKKERLKEISWLEEATIADSCCVPWSTFHSRDNPASDQCPGMTSLMPLINEKVNTLKAQFHIMSMVKKMINHLNQKQISVDVSDQPVYALSKELQLRLPSLFGNDKYICMLGDLHIEQSLLVMHGQLIKGSGLDTIMQNTNLSTAGGTSALVDANHIKRSRYCLQVAVVTIFNLLKRAHVESGSDLAPLQWLDERSKTSQTCFYWRMILNFQIEVLMFVRSIREGNFKLYLETLYRFLKWFFIFDKYNYARWATIYWFDMVLLEKRCPNEFDELRNGNFSFLKTNSTFSRMALDQVHEQNNKHVKSVGGATSLVNRQDDSALLRWELTGPELCRILQEFEGGSNGDKVSKHHEDTQQFRIDFARDTSALLHQFPNNPFQLSDLTVVNNTDTVFEDNIFINLQQLEARGTEQLKVYIEDRLVKSKVSINAKILLNHFALPGSEKGSKPRGSIVDKRLTLPFLTKLRAAITYRRQHALLLFQSEIFDVAQCLSVNSNDMYHGTKSSVLQRIETTEYTRPDSTESSAIIIELSPFFRKEFIVDDFNEYSSKLYEELLKTTVGFERVDIIADRYLPQSLKTCTRKGRGNGPVILFDGKTALPQKFRDSFLKNSDNKERLNLFLADTIFNMYTGDKTWTITKGETILTNDILLAEDPTISTNLAEEADQKIIRHMIQCVQSGIKRVVIRTVDSDVVLSLLAYRHSAKYLDSQVFAWLVAGAKKTCYNITEISIKLGDQVCKALPFFHALTGCDITSSFFNQGKCKFWDRWMEFKDFQKLTEVFSCLSVKPSTVSSEQLNIIEQYICWVYYGDFSEPMDMKRMKDFEHSTHGNLRMLPPSRLGLSEHVKRSVYYSGWINYQSVENVDLPNPEGWGWGNFEGEYRPIWHTRGSNVSDANLVTQVCGCSTEKCTSCRCAKVENFECLPYCKCKRRCLYNPI